MSEFIKYLKNSFDEKNFIKNIDGLNLTDTKNMSNLCQVKINARPDLVKVFIDEKAENRYVFMKASAELFKRKFLGFYLPLIIGGLNIFEYASLADVVTKDLDRYKQTSMVCEDGVIINRGENDNYYEGFDYTFVDDVSKTITDPRMGRITFYIMDGSEGLKFDLSRNSSDGKIKCIDFDDGFYSLLLLQNSEKLNEELPEEYKDLFDDIITYLLDDGSIGRDYREKLKKLNDSDKKKIVFEVIEYEKMGKEEVDIYSYHIFRKIVLGVLAIIASTYIFSRYFNGDNKHWTKLIVTENGLEYDPSDDEEKIFNLFYKYKRAFISAEDRRIVKCVEATENFEEADCLFTKHELEVAKKLVKKL